MWFRHTPQRFQNLVNGLELRVQANGPVWEIVSDSPATNPAVIVLSTGFTSEQNATDALYEYLQNNSISLGATIIAPGN